MPHATTPQSTLSTAPLYGSLFSLPEEWWQHPKSNLHKINLNLFQKATGKKFRLNRLQNKKYRDFDIEAANVSRARKTAAGAGALGVGSGVVAKTYVEDKRREPMYPIN